MVSTLSSATRRFDSMVLAPSHGGCGGIRVAQANRRAWGLDGQPQAGGGRSWQQEGRQGAAPATEGEAACG